MQQVAVTLAECDTAFNEERYHYAQRIGSELAQLLSAGQDPSALAAIKLLLGKIERALGDFERSNSAFAEALAYYIKTENKPNQAQCLCLMGENFNDLDDRPSAKPLFERAANLYEERAICKRRAR